MELIIPFKHSYNMSEIYTDYAGSQTSRFDLDNVQHIHYQNHTKGWLPREAIEWSHELQMDLLSFFTKLDYPFKDITEIPFRDPLRSEIRRFFLSLDAYIESPRPVIPYKSILYGATEKEFSKYLKRVKRKAFETSWLVEHFEKPEWWDEIPQYFIRDIGDIFNYSYLIFFKKDSDDYIWGFEPITQDLQTLDLFEETVFDILPDRDSFSMIDPIEILSEMSPSSSVDKTSNKRKPHYLLKDKELFFSKERNPCHRCIIPVSPENIRDTAINRPSDLNTISLIDKQVMEITRKITGHIHLKNKNIVTKRCNNLYDKYRYFLQRDIRKEGITKPRNILNRMMRALNRKYPDIEVFRYTSFFDKYVLYNNGEYIYPTRGHGLGMANSLTTLMQIAIHELIIDELQNDIPSIDSDMLCINDDFVAGFNDVYHLESYWDREDEIMSKLSIIRQPEKSFVSEQCFVLAERYFTPSGEYEKISYQLRELLLPLACYNVVHAKEYFIASQIHVKSDLVPFYLDRVKAYWGFEFFPNEFLYPSHVGGWINEKINSVSTSLIQLEELEKKSYVYRGFRAAKTKLYKKPRGELFTPPLISLLGNPKIPEHLREAFDIIHINQLNDKYGRVLSRSKKLFKRYYDQLEEKRQRVFKKDFDIPFEELLKGIISSYPTTQFYPCQAMICRYHEFNFIQNNIDDPYIDSNPKMASISKFNSIAYPFKEEFSITFSDIGCSTRKSLSLFAKETKRAIKSDITAAFMTGKYNEIMYPISGYKPENQYLNPVKIGELASLFSWGKGFPEIRKEFEHPLIEKKKEVFNRLFSIPELSLITHLGLSRENLKVICDSVNESGDSLIETLLYLSDRYKEEEEIFYHETSVTEDQDNFEKITMETLLKNPNFIWIWRNDRQSFQNISKDALNLIGELARFITLLTAPGLDPNYRNAEQIYLAFATLEWGREGFFIFDRSGVKSLGDERIFKEEEEMSLEEDFASLFG